MAPDNWQWYEWVKHYEEVIVVVTLVSWFLLSIVDRVDILIKRRTMRGVQDISEVCCN